MNAVSNRNPPKRSIPSWDLRRRNPRSFRVSGVRQDEGGEDVNSTWSGDVFYTASQVFKYTFRFGNFIYASEVNLLPNIKRAPERLLALSVNGHPVFDPNSKDDLDALNTLTNHPVETIEDVIAKSPQPLEVITDQNMIVEFKHGIRFGRKFGAE